jgi:hypothetical protein
MRCRMTASLRATAILALRCPMRFTNRMPHAFNAHHFCTRVRSTRSSCL